MRRARRTGPRRARPGASPISRAPIPTGRSRRSSDPRTSTGREFFTQEEVAALEKRAQEQTGDEGRSKGTRGDVERAYNDFWWDRGTKVTTPRTSLVIDPPDGRVPE